MSYLHSLLDGTAADAISGLSLTSTNYAEAIALLKKRFGNRQHIVNKHMDQLIAIEPVTSLHDLKGLRRLYDKIEAHIRSLKGLGISSESYSSMLSSVLMKRLPQERCVIVSRQTGTDPWNFDDIMQMVEGELEARERHCSLHRTSCAFTKGWQGGPNDIFIADGQRTIRSSLLLLWAISCL